MSLLGQSNVDAMETLRHAMNKAGPEPGSISIAVARPTSLRAGAPVAMATGDAVGKTPCLRQSSTSTVRQSSCALMPPPSTTKIPTVRKPPVGVCARFLK